MAILTRRDENAVAYLTMNAPERLNALSDEMLAALQETLTRVEVRHHRSGRLSWPEQVRPSARAMT